MHHNVNINMLDINFSLIALSDSSESPFMSPDLQCLFVNIRHSLLLFSDTFVRSNPLDAAMACALHDQLFID